jgi:hypothetical protein
MLPELIEIVPPSTAISAGITVPGSKSITNRALILAALADGEVTLRGALWSEDTQIMTAALQTLGFDIAVTPDDREICNRTIRIGGRGGKIPKGGTAAKPLELFVGNAGTAARFLAALVCLGDGVIGCMASSGCTKGRKRRCSGRCGNWAIASNRPTTSCQRRFSGRARAMDFVTCQLKKVRSLLRRCCCARGAADGSRRWRAFPTRKRLTWP